MAVSEVTLTIGPEVGDVPVRQFLDAVGHSLTILRELDSAISMKRAGTLRWVLGRLSLGSPATVTLKGIAEPEGPDLGPEVARSYVDGLMQLETEGIAPPSFTDEALRAAAELSRVRPGPEGRIRVQAFDKTVIITERVSANVGELLPKTFTTTGSVEGRLETATIHDRNYFRVYDPIHGHGVMCYFPDDQLDRVRDAFGRRVSVSGRMRTNQRGDKLSMHVQTLYIFPSEEELPKPSELRGLVPDLTEGLLSEDYVRELWGDDN